MPLHGAEVEEPEQALPVNFAAAEATVVCDAACMRRAMRRADDTPGRAGAFRLRDLVARTDLDGEQTSLMVTLSGNGASVLYHVAPASADP